MNETVDASGEKPGASTVSVHKDVFSYERLVAASVMEAAAFSLSVADRCFSILSCGNKSNHINAKSPDEYRENPKLIGAFCYIRTFDSCHCFFTITTEEFKPKQNGYLP